MPDADRTRDLLAILEVRRNAVLGLAVGLGVAVLAYVYRVFEVGGPTSASMGSPALFLLLAVVLTVTVGALVATALTVRRAVHVARRAEPESEG